jgi:hypothetical protein
MCDSNNVLIPVEEVLVEGFVPSAAPNLTNYMTQGTIALDASDYYVVPVFGGSGIPSSSNSCGTYLAFKDAYGMCETVTYVKKSYA